MRSKLGVAASTIGLALSLTVAGHVAATTPPTDEPVTTDEPVVTDETTTTESTTTLAPDPRFMDPATLGDIDETLRTGSQFQTQTTPPPPPTTTTTTLPDFWQLPPNSGEGRRVVYHKTLQRLWVVEADGTVIKKHLVSGKLTWCDPQPGTYSVYSRSRYTFAIQNPSITWGYMVRFAKGCSGGNIGFHEIPSQYGRPVQSISQLGTPLSGGCVRQAESDAIWMWNWAGIGTKVVVIQ